MAAGTSTAEAEAGSPHVPPRPGRARQVERHPADLVRFGLGLAVLGIGSLVAQRGELPLLERDLFRVVNDLPAIVFPLVWVVMQLGNVIAVPVVAGMALLLRRVRMARDLLISGLLAYGAADLVKSAVGRERPAGFPVGAVLHEGTAGGAGFVSGHAAVAAALATAAAPYLSRRARRIAWALACSVALARVYVGAHLPLDVVGGMATGWAIGSLVHWVFGIPRWQPRPDRVTAMLERFGLPVRDLHPADVRARSSHPFEAVDDTGRRVYVKVLDPDRFERDWLYRLYRLLAVRDLKDDDAVAPLGSQAEHEAVAAMTARERGVRVPRVVLARGGDRGAVVVQEHVTARPLDELGGAELTPALLELVWQQVRLLHAARVAHHDLVASSVLLDASGQPWVVDFGNAETGADDDALAGDRAELMASLALRVDPATVVRTATGVLGTDAVAAALPRLAPLSLSAETRAGLRHRGDRLSLLRREVRASAGLPPPDRLEFGPPGILARVAVAAGSAAVLIGVPLLAGATAVAGSVEVGGWRWLGGAVCCAVLARAASATAALYSVDRRLAVGRTYGATMVADGATLLHGRTGWHRAASRFLERAGVLPESARAAMRRTSIGTVAAAAVVAVGMLVLSAVEGRLSGWRTPDALVPAVLLGAGAWLLVVTGQVLAHRTPVPDRTGAPARTSPYRLLRRPGAGRPPAAALDAWRWGGLLGWSALSIALEGAALAAALHGVGADLPVLTTASLYAGLRLLWAALPLAGAPGAAEVSLLLALTALGAPLAAACAGVLVFRVIVFWVPATLGALLTLRFEHRLML